MRARLRDRRAPPLACVVLAAGGSSRLGRPKQLLRVRGVPLLVRAARHGARAAPGRVVVVLGAEHVRLRGVLRRWRVRVRIVRNPAWRSGLASSLRAGLAAAAPDTAATLVLLTDQPRVDAASLERLVAAWRRRPAKAAAARYSGRLGVPAILPRRLHQALTDVAPDAGARALLAREADVTTVAMPEAAVDVDTPADWQALTRAGNR